MRSLRRLGRALPHLFGPILAGSMALAASARADLLTLRDGNTRQGDVTHMDADSIEIDSCGLRRTYLRARVVSIELDSPQAACKSNVASTAAASALPAGTRLLVKCARPIDSAREPVGQVFAGTVVQPVMQDEQLLIRGGAPVVLQVQTESHEPHGSMLALHVIGVRLDHGWMNIDAPADPIEPGFGSATTPRIVVPSDAPIAFTLRHPTATSVSPQRD